MSKILGLDLGTNSIGWALREPSLVNQNQIIAKGVRIFQKGVGEEKDNEFSLAAARTNKRSSRRHYFRRKLRKIKTLEALISVGMCPLTIEELNDWSNHNKAENIKYPTSDEFKKWLSINPYQVRNKCATQKATLYETGRSFYHLCQRRGYLSNRKDKNPDSNTDKAIEKLNQTKNTRTLGQYFATLNPHENRIRTQKTGRLQLLEEFEQICRIQNIPNDVSKALWQGIFFQRPLKSQKHLTGRCPFEKNKYRCYISHPDFEEFRMFQFINSIKYKNTGGNDSEFIFLTKEHKELIFPKFYRKSKPTFDFKDLQDEINKFAKKQGLEYEFNYKTDHPVSGCPTISSLIDILGPDWRNFKIKHNAIHLKKGCENNSEIDVLDVWHALLTFDSEEKLKLFATDKLSLNNEETIKFSKINLKEGYSSLSLKAIRKILPFLKKGLIYSHAVFLAKLDEILEPEIWNSNKELISDTIAELIKTHGYEKKKSNIVNALIDDFRKNYGNSHKDYVLDQKDKNNVADFIKGEFGKKYISQLVSEQLDHLTSEISTLFEGQLRKHPPIGEFISTKRIDDRIKDFLIDNFNVSDEKLLLIYHPSDIDVYPTSHPTADGKRYLKSPMISSLKNPMAMRALHELRHLVNEMINKEIINENDSIIIELARELNDRNKRTAIRRWQRERNNESEKYREEIKTIYKEQYGKDIEPTDDDILKFRLWKEQESKCQYTGQNIGIADFIGTDINYDIEHTWPRSQSFDNSMANKTLAHKGYNIYIKGTLLPTELPNYSQDTILEIGGHKIECSAIEPRIENWKKKIDDLQFKINICKRRSKSSTTKEQKDLAIQEKHYWSIHLEYWQNKYNRFVLEEIKSGFKNSQLVDTGIITRYARLYLKTVFNDVYAVKGEITARFREMWGLQEEYTKKERINHIHHAIDAVVIACLDRSRNTLQSNLYDSMANYYRDLEEYERYRANKPTFPKPWQTFTEDCKRIETDTLITHQSIENSLKTTKRKLRKGGKIQYSIIDGEKFPRYEKGVGIRGSLHMDTFYGAIKRPVFDKEGKSVTDDNGKQKTEIFYRVSKGIMELKEGDIKNIVDERIRKIIEETGLKNVQQNGVFLPPNLLKNPDSKPTPIKRVKVYARDVKSPLQIKKHSHLSKKEYKHFYNVKNDSNYLMAIYQGVDNKGKTQRAFELVNNFDLAGYQGSDKQYPLYPEKFIKNSGQKDEFILPLIQKIRVGSLVLLFENNHDEIKWDDKTELNKRLYQVKGLSKQIIQEKYDYGVIVLLLHNVAQRISDLKMQDGEFKLGDNKYYRKLNHNQFKGLIENVDFNISITGEIIKL